jgi:hypothetical protein
MLLFYQTPSKEVDLKVNTEKTKYMLCLATRMQKRTITHVEKITNEHHKIFSGNRPCQLWTKAQSQTISATSIPLMMETEMVSETLGFCPQPTLLVSG